MNYLNPVAWFRWLGDFLKGWVLTRPLRDSPKMIAAILSFLFIALGIFASGGGADDQRQRMWEGQVRNAFVADDYETAELVVQRQLKADPRNNELVLKYAEIKSANDKPDEAAELMRMLVERRRDPKAAMWLVQKEFIGKQWNALGDEGQKEFGELLELLNRDEPNNLMVKQLYADYLVLNNDLEPAVLLLDDLGRTMPMRGLQAAALARKLGNRTVAERLAKRTLTTVRGLLEKDPGNVLLALAVAQNQLFLDDHKEAIRTLKRSMDKAKDDKAKKQLRQATGDAIVNWIDHLERGEIKSDVERVQVMSLLQTALAVAPNNPRVLRVVADQVLATMTNKDKEISKLRRALVKGSSPGVAHFIRGTGALMLDDYERASKSLKLAAELLPNSAAILNNLAVALFSRGEEYYEEALKVSEKAIEQAVQPTPHFFETRGQILAALDRHLDAIPDLERALLIKDLQKGAHTRLAECYAAIDEPELAEMHREAAEEAPKVEAEKPADDLEDSESDSSDPVAEGSTATAETDDETASE